MSHIWTAQQLKGPRCWVPRGTGLSCSLMLTRQGPMTLQGSEELAGIRAQLEETLDAPINECLLF